MTEIRLTTDGRNARWTLTIPMPECPHPVEHQIITGDGVECGICGETQDHDESAVAGVDP